MRPAELSAQRKALHLSQAALARMLGVARNTLARWERGDLPISKPVLVRLALERLSGVPTDSAPLARGPADVPHVRRSNLPADLSSFVGREAELARISELLLSTRLLTLTGTGGVGKTRLALRAAAEAARRYADGAWLLELAALKDETLVAGAAAKILDTPDRAGQGSLETLCDGVRDRELLLVLDNCEHLLPACVELVEAILRAAAGVRILATSREAFGIPGEVIWPVPPLSLPPVTSAVTCEAVGQSPAGRLFLDRASAVAPGFVLTHETAATVVHVCRRLEGMPLALELAAARLDHMPLEEIAGRLNDRLRLLGGVRWRGPPRQQSLRATIDWSHDLLSEPEQRLFRRLAVFAGGWTLEAAEATCIDDDLPPAIILDLLASLVRKSLVLIEERGGTASFRLLDTLHEYAEAKLAEAHELEDVKRRHAQYYLAIAEAAEPHLIGAARREWLARLEYAHDNLRAALTWSQVADQPEFGLRLAATLAGFWSYQGHLDEGRRWLRESLRQAAAAEDVMQFWRPKALAGAGRLAHQQGDPAAAGPLLEEAIVAWRSMGNARALAYALTDLGQVHLVCGDLLAARACANESVALFRSIDDRPGLALALQDLAALMLRRPGVDYAAARVLYQEELALFTELGDTWGRGLPLLGLGRIALGQGEYVRAGTLLGQARAAFEAAGDRRLFGFVLNRLAELARVQRDFVRAAGIYRQSLEVWWQLRQALGLAAALEGLAVCASAWDQPDRAARLFGAADGLREESGALSGWPTDDPTGRDRGLALTRAALGEADFQAAWREARARPLVHVERELAAGQADFATIHHGRRVADRGPLTAREREIASLVVRGLSNNQIAAELVVSERTVDNHLQHIREKLGMHSRAQIAAWSVEDDHVRSRDAERAR